MLNLRGWNGTDYIYELIQADPKNVVPKRVNTYKLDIPITKLVDVDDVDYNKINESNRTLTNVDNDKKTYQIKIINIPERCKDWISWRDADECKISFEGVPESEGGRSRSSKKRPSARRRRSSNAHKSRKTRTTRRK
jgi:hypothetical protein